MYLGEVYYRLGEYRKAIQAYETLLPLLRNEPDPAKGDRTWTYNNLAGSYNALGEKQKARDFYKESLWATEQTDRFLQQTKDHPIAPGAYGLALTSLGNFSIQLGEKQEALDYLFRALPYLKVNRQNYPETYRLARAYRGLSEIYASLGDFKSAISYAKDAYQYSHNTADFDGEVAALNILGTISAKDVDYPTAISKFREALRVSTRTGDRKGQATALANLGFLYLNSSALNQATASYNEAANLFRSIEHRAGEAQALTGLGMLARIEGDSLRAIELYQKALPMHKGTMDREGEAETLYELARAHLELGQVEAAYAEIARAIERIEFIRRSFSATDMRAAYRSTVDRYYELYIRLLMLLHYRNPLAGFDVQAFQQSDYSKARTLLESLREGGLNVNKEVNPILIKRERELRQLLNDKSTRAAILGGELTSEQKAQAELEVRNLEEELGKVQSEIRTSSPHLAGLMQPQIYTLRQIQDNVLDVDSVLLEYELGEDESFLWFVSKDSFKTVHLPKRSKIEDLGRKVLLSLTANRRLTDEAKQLSTILLSPITSQIPGKRLLIVGSGIIQYIPF